MAACCVLLPPRGLALGSSTSTQSFAGSAALMKRSRSILRYIRCQYWCLVLLCVHCRAHTCTGWEWPGDVCLFFGYICLSLFLFLLFNPLTSSPSLLPSIRLSLLPSLPPTLFPSPLLPILLPPPPDPPPFLTLFPHSLWTTPPPPCTFTVVGLWRPWSLLPLAHSLSQRFIFTASSLKRLLHGCQN